MFRSQPRRRAFTLIELLVVIVIIGILIGLLLVAFGPVRNRTLTFAIQSENQQLVAALEQFKIKFGFYPPSHLGDLNNPNDLVTFKAYLRKIAPDHAETNTTIGNWWNEVGKTLDNDSILVFWLSGVNQSAQYPLTAYGSDMQYGTADDEVAYAFNAEINPPARPRIMCRQANMSCSSSTRLVWKTFKTQTTQANSTSKWRGTCKAKSSISRIHRSRRRPIRPPTFTSMQRLTLTRIPTPMWTCIPTRWFRAKCTPSRIFDKVHQRFSIPIPFSCSRAGVDRQFNDMDNATPLSDPTNWTLQPDFAFARDNVANFSDGVLERVAVEQ